MRLLLLPLLASQLAADSLAGRWAMQAEDPSKRIFWMEVTNLQPPAGNFFGATGGRLEHFRDASVVNGRLRFHVARVFPSTPPRTMAASVDITLRDGGLQGAVTIGDRVYPVKGWRSPTIKDRDDGTWRDSAAISLLDDSLSKWRTPGRSDWRVADGVLKNISPDAALLVSNGDYWNFRLRLEYKLPKDGNAGIGLRHHYELQLADDYGQPPDVHGNASLYSQIAPTVNASRPANEWQELELTLIGRDLTVTLNGRRVIDRQPIRGLTGLALDPHEERPGPVSLQGDHGIVEYRNIVITPLIQ